jgi:cobalt-zinc-cadmium efflux system protein
MPTDHDHGHGHSGHSHAHNHAAGATTRTLGIALALTGCFVIVEVVAGLMFGSLALLSDAAHMFTDAAALAIALVAIRLGRRAADEKRSYGYRRFEILAAAFNAILLFGVAVYVFVEGIARMIDPPEVESTGMLAVAFAGLIVNLIAMRLLASGKNSSLNVKGAYLEVWSDMLGSLGVIAGAALIAVTGWRWIDPLVAIAIALWVLPRTWLLLRESTHILLEGAPRGIALNDIREAIATTAGVAGLHDLHVWVSGADSPSSSVHIELINGCDAEVVRVAVAERLLEFGLHHVTIQTEERPCVSKEKLHP